MMRANKGASQVDWVIAIILFLFVVAVAYGKISQSSFIGDPTVSKKEQSINAKAVIENDANWNLFQERIVVNASSQQRPLELTLFLDRNLDNNSVSVMTENKALVASDYYPNESLLVVDAPLSTTTTFLLSYARAANLSKIAYGTNIVVTDTGPAYECDNARLRETFAPSGLSTVQFLGATMIESIDLSSVTLKPTFFSGAVRSKFLYSDTNVSCYSNSSLLTLKKPGAEEITFAMTLASYDKYYNGSVVDIPGAGATIDSGTYNWIDLYKTAGNGFAIFASGAGFLVTKNATHITVKVNNQKDIEILFHTGTFVNAINESNNANGGLSVFIQSPLVLEGISADKANGYANSSYEALKAKFGINYDFNITINGTQATAGKRMPSDQPVYLSRYPATLLDRFGMQNQTTIAIGVW